MIILVCSLVGLWLCLYLLQMLTFAILGLWYHYKSPAGSPSPPLPSDWPPVTIQLPLFNEAAVVERLLQAVTKISYPQHRLQIQVLDDSTDSTTELALSLVSRYRRAGHSIELVRRGDRRGYKAGALDHGLATAVGEYVVIFDADFLPSPDFLEKTLPWLLVDPELAFVQARWGHVNRDYSTTTTRQALMLDAPALIDQVVRLRLNLPICFQGTAGVWRKEAINAAGGWQAETLCEDLDLSCRAQIAGWKALFLPDLVVPAELSPQLVAFKQQQFRWSKGWTQCLKKLTLPILRSSWPWWKKLLTIIWLSGQNLTVLLLSLVVVVPLFAVSTTPQVALLASVLFNLANLVFPFYYAVGLRLAHPNHWKWLVMRDLPIFLCLAPGLWLNAGVAVWQGLTGSGAARFDRTPKFNVVERQDNWHHNPYRLPINAIVLGEIGISAFCLLASGILYRRGLGFVSPICLFYSLSFAASATLSLWQGRSDITRWWSLRRSSRA